MAVDEKQTPHEQQVASSSLDQPRYPLIGITTRSLVLAIVISYIASFWINQTEVISHFCQITESVPPIPAVAGLLVLVIANPLVRRLAERLSLERREILMIYVFLTVTGTVTGCGIGRFFMSILPVVFYFDTPENNFASLQGHMPQWMVPHDREVIRKLYEASESGAVPWGAWAAPMLMWGIFFLAVWICMLCLTTLFNRQWSEKEKLTYPLLYLPMECTEGVDGPKLLVDFLRNKIMWIGFAIAFVYNITNIVNSYNPAFTALGKSYDLGQLFTEHPMTALRPMTIHYRPELIGFGYLVPTEIAFSVWVFYGLMKLEGLGVAMSGIEMPGYPFWQERGLGAYVAVCLLLAFIGRHHLADVFNKALKGHKARNPAGEPINDDDEPMSYRMAVFGGLVAFVVVIAWMKLAGMALWLAATYMILVFMLAIVYARIRAEVGVPLIWMYPYYQSFKGIRYFLGSGPFRSQNGWGSATIYATFVFMSRGYYSSMMGYQVEGFRLARGTGIKQRSMNSVLVVALVVGFTISMTGLLRSYYEFGAGGLNAMEGWGSGIAVQEYQVVTDFEKAALKPDVPRIVATGGGFAIAVGLMLLRMAFLRFPLHPLAFCMICSYGELVWGAFLIVWLIKSAVFKLGGMRVYRQLIPGFVGLALGHYFTAGFLWGLIGAYGEVSQHQQSYRVWFG